MNERLEHRLGQRNRHTPQAQFSAGAVNAHAQGRRGISRLMLHGRHNFDSTVVRLPGAYAQYRGFIAMKTAFVEEREPYEEPS
jgi:hypothetical protein